MITDDRKIKDMIKTNPKYHEEMADRFKAKLLDKTKESGMSQKDINRIYGKMKMVDDLKRKISKGKLSEDYAFGR